MDIDSQRVRSATPGDAPWMAALDARVSFSPWSKEGYAESLRHNRGWIIEQGSDPAGFVLCSQVLDEAEVLNIIVDPSSQGRGFGGVLLKTALKSLRDLGVRRCYLDVRRSNAPAIALYEGLGFLQSGVRNGYYRSAAGPEDALLYTLILQETD